MALLGALAGPTTALAEGPWRRVDHVVLEVGATVITRSELEAQTRLALLDARGPEVARTAPLTVALLRSVLRSMAQRELLLAESRRLGVRAASEAEALARVERWFARFPSDTDALRFFERLGLGAERAPSAPGEAVEARGRAVVPAGLLDAARAEIAVARFVELRVRPSVIVRAAEIDACFAANRARLLGVPEEEGRRAVEETLRDAAFDRALAALISQLERRTPVRAAAGLELGSVAAAERDAGEGIVCPTPTK